MSMTFEEKVAVVGIGGIAVYYMLQPNETDSNDPTTIDGWDKFLKEQGQGVENLVHNLQEYCQELKDSYID